MKTKTNQSAAEKNIATVALVNIQPSGFNPRKRFDEAALYELVENIKRQGVLQPTTVRPVDGTDRYGIVFGERRCHASIVADRDEIPAIITELSDEETEEVTVTKNLQRKDMIPVEGATVYQRFIESGRHTVQTLAQLFGENKSYIRAQLKSTALIPEIAAPLEADELTISVTAEICRYGGDIQRGVYEKHLQDGEAYNSWRRLEAADVTRHIEQNFTADLRCYRSDKAEYATRAHNTNDLLLFCGGGYGHCANRICLTEMNVSYLMERAVQIIQTQPGVSLYRDRYCISETVAEWLTASGYEVETLDRYTALPDCPKEPKAENFNNPGHCGEAHTHYEQQWADYMEQGEEITRKSEAGKITIYAKIGQREIDFCYVKNVTEAQTADRTPAPAPPSPTERLEKQDERNREVALERTMEDTKEQVLEADIMGDKFSADEDMMLYFFLPSSLRKEHFTAVRIAKGKQYITDEDKVGIIGSLTVRTKTIIRRDFLVANFKGVYSSSTMATLLLDFVRRHMPEEPANIEREYNGVYEERHQCIEEKKAVPLMQERARERRVTQPEERP